MHNLVSIMSSESSGQPGKILLTRRVYECGHLPYHQIEREKNKLIRTHICTAIICLVMDTVDICTNIVQSSIIKCRREISTDHDLYILPFVRSCDGLSARTTLRRPICGLQIKSPCILHVSSYWLVAKTFWPSSIPSTSETVPSGEVTPLSSSATPFSEYGLVSARKGASRVLGTC